jgi:hypothetical protein
MERLPGRVGYRGQMSDPEFRIDIPAERVLGVHADYASVWHTPETVVIDFLAMNAPASTMVGADGEEVPVLNATVASRIRIPPTHVFELMKALETQLAQWEIETGRRNPL